ncbi:Rieske 2Fe-2S domain-containing protein [Nocardioides sp. Kera G14]|uniref:Rieske 2Fe-2S domain-containing protein n=1 Tax=Nocardioides sp. Kera G14 TaxID=2884264 RepID=UPI001D111567|nr:Rieske 2Fe-2S domain-containing protein [Nocardioides sp. Kera G14]UDY22207.1 aromatic ring-hydroxylating dioxygenase subunit alpha [Nocardioides sp. Kera G14]
MLQFESRSLDKGTTPERYARGWHCIGLLSDFADGKPHAVPAFGGKLVVWADSKGEVHVLDGFCRHMGGDLTQGTVKGDNIACPFHDWRWGGDGKCKEIPYARRVPLRARTQRYETVVRNGQILFWHDPEGSAADHDILPPELPGLADGEYTPFNWNVVEINGSHCRELVDNVVDMAHFYYVHFAFPTDFRNVFEGTQATQYMKSVGRPDKAAEQGGYAGEDLFLSSEATYYGPAYMINWLETDYKGFKTEVILINCHIPTGPTSFSLHYGLSVRKPEGLDDATADYIAKKYTDMFGSGFLQDVHIWENKAPVQNPLLCEEDGPVYQLRRWYEQFYVDVADIEPDMTARFEFEVDTTKANEYWHAEVAENLKAKAELEGTAH